MARRLYGNRWHDSADVKKVKERNKTIRIRRRRGETFQSIANSYGLTRQRVHQIVNGEGR